MMVNGIREWPPKPCITMRFSIEDLEGFLSDIIPTDKAVLAQFYYSLSMFTVHGIPELYSVCPVRSEQDEFREFRFLGHVKSA